MTVEISAGHTSTIDTDAIASFAQATLEREGVAPNAVLSLAFVGEEAIAELNQAHMGKAGATDVLSFPIEDAEPGIPPVAVPEGPDLELGDIFICPEVVTAHSVEYGVTFEDELYLMVCHGVLHILGWDHQTDEDARAMEGREAEHLATVGRVRR